MAPSEDLENLQLHTPHIQALATLNTRNRNALLTSAGPLFVRALSTLARVLHANGYEFPDAHLRRARRLISKNTAARTKQVLVSGEPGKVSRGGGFFSKMAKAAIAAGLVAAAAGAGVAAATRRGGSTPAYNPEWDIPAPTHRVSGPWDLDQVYPDY
jgi:hypothetical protein